jgi:mRNA interferase MazF
LNIHFPQADLRAGKLRPSLVIAVAPGRHSDVLLALVTSRGYQAVTGFDDIIDPADDDFAQTGLRARSIIRLARLVSVETLAIEARLGTISPTRLQRVRQRLIEWLAI